MKNCEPGLTFGHLYIYGSNEQRLCRWSMNRIEVHHPSNSIYLNFVCILFLYLLFTYIYILLIRVEKEFYVIRFAFAVVFAYIILFFTIGRTDNFLYASVKCKTIYHHTTYIRCCVCVYYLM